MSQNGDHIMSTFIDSFILLILGAVLYPSEQLDALHIMWILLLLSLYCFEYITTNEKTLKRLGVPSLVLCFFLPELCAFLPLLCYIFFYRKQYLLPYLYIMPAVLYLYKFQEPACLLVLPFTGISLYLAHQNNLRDTLQQKIKTFRDNSVEKEMILKRNNEQLLENQDNQIYSAILKERNRIAREIHDNVGHMLSRSILQTGALLTVCKDETLKPHLEALKDTLNASMDSIRSSVHDLHDESVDLKEALSSLISHFTFCPVTFSCEISRNIPRDVKYCILAITKEALNNIIKHSNATRASVTVKEHPGFYQLLIEDNGTTAADHFSEKERGIGLSNMRDRVNGVHGILHISAETGFRIFMSVPK